MRDADKDRSTSSKRKVSTLLVTTVLSCALLSMATVASLGFVIAAVAESEACAALCRRPRTRGRPRVEALSVRCRGLGS